MIVELEEAVDFYEELVSTYGPVPGKWKVHKLRDFSGVFQNCSDFISDISGWDMSKAEPWRDVKKRANGVDIGDIELRKFGQPQTGRIEEF